MVTENFDNETPGQPPAHWINSVLNPMVVIVVSNSRCAPHSPPNSMAFTNAVGEGRCRYEYPLGFPAYIHVWYFQQIPNPILYRIALSEALGEWANNQLGPYLIIQNLGDVFYSQWGVGVIDTGIDAPANQWNKFTFVNDIANNQFDLYVNDVFAGTFPFYRARTALTTLHVSMNSPNADFLDDLQLGPLGPPTLPTVFGGGNSGGAEGPLSIGEIYSTGVMLVRNNSSIRGTIAADQKGTVRIKQGSDLDNLDYVDEVNFVKGVGDEFNIDVKGFYCEMEVENTSGVDMADMKFGWVLKHK